MVEMGMLERTLGKIRKVVDFQNPGRVGTWTRYRAEGWPTIQCARGGRDLVRKICWDARHSRRVEAITQRQEGQMWAE